MKKLKDLNLNVIEDKNALTIKGGCEGRTTKKTEFVMDPGWMFGGEIVEYGDWEDDGCCE
ncbi:hypothetical protein U6A24_20485 [Aquimarina gracilis]|uniref:Uncharacterized protein n=1 Tax=Aquimarina gracilis TaxID=874422 RepID=A0ABU6A175_9FLAO|nr:hypothetical protein [Aquimarina gracilis]MEB3347867.1 hypothetical protein [Aquimarina gracilis]